MKTAGGQEPGRCLGPQPSAPASPDQDHSRVSPQPPAAGQAGWGCVRRLAGTSKTPRPSPGSAALTPRQTCLPTPTPRPCGGRVCSANQVSTERQEVRLPSLKEQPIQALRRHPADTQPSDRARGTGQGQVLSPTHGSQASLCGSLRPRAVGSRHSLLFGDNLDQLRICLTLHW